MHVRVYGDVCHAFLVEYLREAMPAAEAEQTTTAPTITMPSGESRSLTGYPPTSLHASHASFILHGISVKKNAFDLHKRMIFNMTFFVVVVAESGSGRERLFKWVE